MKGYLSFCKKECLESVRTYRLFILLGVFFLFGMVSPLLTKLMPELFASMDLAGMSVTIPPQTALDAYAQFFKNTSQIGVVALLLVFCGSLSGELSKGTLIPMLTKGLSRSAVILSKYTVALGLWSLSFLLAAVTNYGYTAFLFGGAGAENLVFSHFCFWLFGAFLLALLYLSSTLVKGSFGGLILTVVVLVALLVGGAFPAVARWDPISLASQNAALLNGSAAVSSVLPALYLTAGATLSFLVLALLRFRKQGL